jgi:hypothetical protein
MKKIFLFAALLVTALTLSACTNTSIDDIVTEEKLSSEESLATLSYLSTGFLDFSTPVVLSNVMLLSNGSSEKPVIEDELDTVNVYFDRLKALIDNGVEDFGSVEEEDSDNELYDYKLTFTVNEEVYVIYYSIDEVTAEMTGIIVVGTVEYTFEVVDNMKEYKYQEQEKNSKEDAASKEENKNNDSDEAEEPDDSDDADTDEQETKMMLIAHNGDDYIKVIYKTEVEDDETTTKFMMEQSVAGVTKEVALKISMEENEYKITIEENEDRYTFKQEVEDNVVTYKLNYKVDGVVGVVKITEITDELGNVTYDYHITEANKEKHIEKQEPKSNGFDDDDEDEEDESEGTDL